MKNVKGGDAPQAPENESGKCCLNSNPSDCSSCTTGLRCNSNATWVSCTAA